MTDSVALLLIDIQHDFLPGGALAVPQADDILEPIRLIARGFKTLVATQDWHPAGHKSFASSHAGKSVYDSIPLNGFHQTLWPDHCVQETAGAAIHPDILSLGIEKIIRKGTQPEIDSYSGFFDNQRKFKTDLHDFLQASHITKLVVGGLATDYCVKFTVLDALELGYSVVVFVPGVRGVNLNPGDSDRALAEMQKAGATLSTGLSDVDN